MRHHDYPTNNRVENKDNYNKDVKDVSTGHDEHGDSTINGNKLWRSGMLTEN